MNQPTSTTGEDGRDLATVFSENLRRFLDKIPMTQKSLAEQSGLSETTITSLLRSPTQVRFETLEKIAPVLGVDCFALLQK